MNIDEIMTKTFADNEHLAPDSSDVLRSIRADLDRGGRQYLTRLAPVLGAAVIIAIALTVVITRSSGLHSAEPPGSGLPTPTPTPTPTQTPTSTSTANSEAAATSAANAILHGIPLPPGAHATSGKLAVLGQGSGLVLSSLEAEASGTWLIPGTVPATVAFARAHPASGFTPNCTCGGRTVIWIDFYNNGDQRRAINYVVAPYASGVAIRITAIVPWVPVRPRWSYVAVTATSVEVTVERVRRFGSVRGAPTVHRTLTSAVTRRLAAVANRLRPQAPSICNGPAIEIAATDTLIFHEPDRTITFTMSPTNCPQFRVDVTGQQPTYLETAALDATLLHELGLPPNYGR